MGFSVPLPATVGGAPFRWPGRTAAEGKKYGLAETDLEAQLENGTDMAGGPVCGGTFILEIGFQAEVHDFAVGGWRVPAAAKNNK